MSPRARDRSQSKREETIVKLRAPNESRPRSVSGPSSRQGFVEKAKEIIGKANDKINNLTTRCSDFDSANTVLKEQILSLKQKDAANTAITLSYKSEIDSQKQNILQLKQKMDEISAKIERIKDKQKRTEKKYEDKMITISDTLYKVQGESISKFKYSKVQSKCVAFIERLNHLFYTDEHGGQKVIMVQSVSTENVEIESEIAKHNDNCGWFLVIGKKRNALFVTESMELRDKWVTFIRSSLDNNATNGEDEYSVLGTLMARDSESDIINSESSFVQFVTNPISTNRTKRTFSSTLVSMQSRITSKMSNRHTKTSSLSLSRLKTQNSNTKDWSTNRRDSESFSISALDSAPPMPVIDPNAPVHVVVTYEIIEDKIDAFMKAITPIIIETNKSEGCVRYNLHRDRRNPCKMVMLEEWENQECLTRHLKSDTLTKYRQNIQKLAVHESIPAVYLCNNLF